MYIYYIYLHKSLMLPLLSIYNTINMNHTNICLSLSTTLPPYYIGCSGLLGLYTEFGPWRAGANKTLFRNPFAWTKYANLVFLEQPVGVGFSYADPPISDTGKTEHIV